MQYFGQIETKYEEVFLTSSYMYFNYDDEILTPKDLKQKIKTLCAHRAEGFNGRLMHLAPGQRLLALGQAQCLLSDPLH